VEGGAVERFECCEGILNLVYIVHLSHRSTAIPELRYLASHTVRLHLDSILSLKGKYTLSHRSRAAFSPSQGREGRLLDLEALHANAVSCSTRLCVSAVSSCFKVGSHKLFLPPPSTSSTRGAAHVSCERHEKIGGQQAGRHE
jgi:hypothetical protein